MTRADAYLNDIALWRGQRFFARGGYCPQKSLLAPWSMGRKGFRVATQIANCRAIYRFETYDKGYGPVAFATRSESGLSRTLPTARTDRRFSLRS